jgi:two-component system LytT family sensor kinase
MTRPAGQPPIRGQVFRIAAAVWLTFGVVQVAQSYVLSLATGRAWTLGATLISGMPWWFSWLLLTPLIGYLAGRFPFSGGRHWSSLGAHAVAAILISSFHLALTGAVFWFTTGQDLGVATSLGNQVQRWFGNFFLESVITYAGAAGVIIAMDYARAARDETVERARLEAQAAELATSVANARLDALSMQLNPHFLFNTLSAISGLIAQDRRSEAREVIQRLGELLRRTLSSGNGHFSSVAREVELLEDYLFIQRIRFSDRLSVRMTVAEAARDCPIPPMLLQPLVENAIRHGVEPNEGRGDVGVQVERVSASLRIVISDSGGGFAMNGNGAPSHEGIGISNTRARLEHLYGDKATLILQNRREGGAEAIVVLPASVNGTNGSAALG